ncbi:MAG: FliH/SctL family protein [Desulfatiglandaceae bacterium]
MEEHADRIREKAYAQGFDEGEKAGAEAEKAKFKAVLETLYAGISELDSERQKLGLEAERQAVELGVMIAGKILCREVSMDTETIFRILEEALKKLSDHKDIRVKIHPSDLEAINTAKAEIPGLNRAKEPVTLEPDKGLRRGECVIETDFGIIDARFDSQMQAVEEAMKRALENVPMESSVAGK